MWPACLSKRRAAPGRGGAVSPRFQEPAADPAQALHIDPEGTSTGSKAEPDALPEQESALESPFVEDTLEHLLLLPPAAPASRGSLSPSLVEQEDTFCEEATMAIEDGNSTLLEEALPSPGSVHTVVDLYPPGATDVSQAHEGMACLIPGAKRTLLGRTMGEAQFKDAPRPLCRGPVAATLLLAVMVGATAAACLKIGSFRLESDDVKTGSQQKAARLGTLQDGKMAAASAARHAGSAAHVAGVTQEDAWSAASELTMSSDQEAPFLIAMGVVTNTTASQTTLTESWTTTSRTATRTVAASTSTRSATTSESLTDSTTTRPGRMKIVTTPKPTTTPRPTTTTPRPTTRTPKPTTTSPRPTTTSGPTTASKPTTAAGPTTTTSRATTSTTAAPTTTLQWPPAAKSPIVLGSSVRRGLLEEMPIAEPAASRYHVRGTVTLRSSGRQAEVERASSSALAKLLGVAESSLSVVAKATEAGSLTGRRLAATPWQVNYQFNSNSSDVTQSMYQTAADMSAHPDQLEGALASAFAGVGIALDSGSVQTIAPEIQDDGVTPLSASSVVAASSDNTSASSDTSASPDTASSSTTEAKSGGVDDNTAAIVGGVVGGTVGVAGLVAGLTAGLLHKITSTTTLTTTSTTVSLRASTTAAAREALAQPLGAGLRETVAPSAEEGLSLMVTAGVFLAAALLGFVAWGVYRSRRAAKSSSRDLNASTMTISEPGSPASPLGDEALDTTFQEEELPQAPDPKAPWNNLWNDLDRDRDGIVSAQDILNAPVAGRALALAIQARGPPGTLSPPAQQGFQTPGMHPQFSFPTLPAPTPPVPPYPHVPPLHPQGVQQQHSFVAAPHPPPGYARRY